MIELKLYVSDVDYDSVIQALAGHLAGPAVMAARALPESAREEAAARFISANAGRLEAMLEGALASKGVHMRISGAQATVVER